MKLRDYQVDMISRLGEALRTKRRVVLRSETGSGKTLVACHMMQKIAASGKRSIFMVHQNELLQQTSRSLWENKLQHGQIAAGRVSSPCLTQVASVMTLKNRLKSIETPDYIIVDECHRVLGESYLKIINAFPNARVIGLTATPRRTDGRGLGRVFEDIVEGPSMRYLIEAGYLCDYELFGVPVGIDTDGIKTTAGDFNRKELERATNTSKITGDAVGHYKRIAMGLKCVVVCVGIKHADDVAAAYTAAGIPALSIHGGTKNRDAVIDQFENGDVQVLVSVNLLIEGVDIPKIACVQILRATQSLVVYMQAVGRGLRPHPGKSHLIVLDHAQNFRRHGLPDQLRDWPLDDIIRRQRDSVERDLGVQDCHNCFFTFRSGVSQCPRCGTEVELRERVPQIIDGELERIREAEIKRQEMIARKQEQGMSKTLPELIEIGIRRKMKNPPGWAANIVASRSGRRPSQDDFKAARRVYSEIVRNMEA